jgi:hypothetical protein
MTKHIIKKQILDLALDSQVGSFTFQSEVGSIYKKEIVPLIDQYCSAIDTGDRVIRIDKLDVDLGQIDKQDFGRQFKQKFAQLLPQKLTEALQMSSNRDFFADETTFQYFNTATDRDFAVLEFFLYEGCLPWWVSGDASYEMPVLLQQNIATRPDKVKRLIAGTVDNAVGMKRLIYHANDEILGQIITLFQPEHGQAIHRLAQALLAGLIDCPLLKSSGAAKLRSEVWKTLLLQSVTSEGQGFNRQLAVETTVKRIAKISGVDECTLSNQLVTENGDHLNALSAQTAKQPPPKRPIHFKGGNFTEEYWRQLEKVAQLFEAFPIVLAEKVLPQQIADFEKRCVQLQLITDAVVNQKMVRADQKIIPKISKALAALIKQLNKRKAADSSIATVKYTRQLKTLEKLLVQLAAGETFPEAANNLAQLLQTVQKTAKLLNGLLNTNRKNGVSSPPLDEELAKKNDRFLVLFDKLRDDLAVVAEQNSGAKQSELLQNISSLIATIEQLNAKPVAPLGRRYFDPFSASEELYVSNAGLVLLWPYLSRFFSIVGLVGANRFIDGAAAERAVLLLHYLVTGTEKVQEYELVLNKIICGIDANTPVKPHLEITEAEKVECESLLQAAILNWPAIKNVSVPGLRSLFLHREGLIFTRDGQRVLRVAGTAYDILVQQIPWGIGTVKLPWMRQLLLVEWGMSND